MDKDTVESVMYIGVEQNRKPVNFKTLLNPYMYIVSTIEVSTRRTAMQRDNHWENILM